MKQPETKTIVLGQPVLRCDSSDDLLTVGLFDPRRLAVGDSEDGKTCFI